MLAVTLTVYMLQRAQNGENISQLLPQLSGIIKHVARMTIGYASLNYFHEQCQCCFDVAFARISNTIRVAAAAAETPQATAASMWSTMENRGSRVVKVGLLKRS